MKHLINLLVSLLLLVSYIPQAYSAEHKISKSETLSGNKTKSLPVFFATDRLSKQMKKGHLAFGTQDPTVFDKLIYGATNTGEVAHQSNTIADREDKQNEEFASTSTPLNETTYKDYAEFEASLVQAVNRSGKQDIVIFVHGCCENFERVARQAEQLGIATDSPVISYDWGTPMANYFGSLVAHPRSQERFNQFILNVLKTFPNKRISIVGLSMGNALIYNFCLQTPVSQMPRLFDNISIARADIDSFAFQTNMEKVLSHSKRVQLYVASNDFLINLSGFLRKMAWAKSPFFMLGHQSSKPALKPQFEVYDISKLKLGHKLPKDLIAEVIKSNHGAPQKSLAYSFANSRSGIIIVQADKS